MVWPPSLGGRLRGPWYSTVDDCLSAAAPRNLGAPMSDRSTAHHGLFAALFGCTASPQTPVPFTPPGLTGRRKFPASTNAPKGPHRFPPQGPQADEAGAPAAGVCRARCIGCMTGNFPANMNRSRTFQVRVKEATPAVAHLVDIGENRMWEIRLSGFTRGRSKRSVWSGDSGTPKAKGEPRLSRAKTPLWHISTLPSRQFIVSPCVVSRDDRQLWSALNCFPPSPCVS